MVNNSNLASSDYYCPRIKKLPYPDDMEALRKMPLSSIQVASLGIALMILDLEVLIVDLEKDCVNCDAPRDTSSMIVGCGLWHCHQVKCSG